MTRRFSPSKTTAMSERIPAAFCASWDTGCWKPPKGVAALEILQAHPEIDLLFTDVGLPGGMNGRQLASAARNLNRKLKVLFTTGYARNAIVHEGRLDPGVQLITKPFSYAALSGKVRDMLDARAAPPRILVVEDEDLIQMLLSSQLEDMGFEVEISGSAAAAKNKLALAAGSSGCGDCGSWTSRRDGRLPGTGAAHAISGAADCDLQRLRQGDAAEPVPERAIHRVPEQTLYRGAARSCHPRSRDQAITFILEAAAAARSSRSGTSRRVGSRCGRVRSRERGLPPMICCSELNRLPKRFCAVPTGVGAAVLLEESVVGSNSEAFLWPWPWPWGCIFTAGRAGVTAEGMVSDDIGYPLERLIMVERQQFAAVGRQRRNLAAPDGGKSI